MIEIYSRVRLLTDKYREEDGVGRGAIGYIVETYGGDDYEVEFSREDGSTIALFSAKESDLEVAPKQPTDDVSSTE